MPSSPDPSTGELPVEIVAPAGKPDGAATGAEASTGTNPEDASAHAYDPDRPKRRLGEAYFALVCLIGLIGLNVRLGRMWQGVVRADFAAIFAASYDPFHYPPNDVSALDAERIRRAVGSDKPLKEVRGKEELDAIVRSFRTEKTRNSRTALIVYVNMHARLDEDDNVWLLPADAKLNEFLPLVRDDNAMKLASLLEEIEQCSYGKKLVFLDIMHSLAAPERGILDDQLAGEVKKLLDEHESKLQKSDTCVISACRGDECSWTSPELGYSPFAFYLARALANLSGNSRMLRAETLVDELRHQVNKWTKCNRGVSQRPFLSGAKDWSLRLHRARNQSTSETNDETELAIYLQGKADPGKPILAKPYPPELLSEWRKREKYAKEFDMPRYAPWALHLWDRSLVRAEQCLTQGGKLNEISKNFPKDSFLELVKNPKDLLDRMPKAEETGMALGESDTAKKKEEYRSMVIKELIKPKKADRSSPDLLVNKPGKVLSRAPFALALEGVAEELRGDEYEKLEYLVQLFLCADKSGDLRKGSYLDQKTVDGLIALKQGPPGGDVDLPGSTLRALLVIACQRSALTLDPFDYAWIKDDAEAASKKSEQIWKDIVHVWKTQIDPKERRNKDREAGDELGKRQSFEIVVKKGAQLRTLRKVYQEAAQKLPYLGDYLLSTPDEDKDRWKEQWKTWEICAASTKELADFFAPVQAAERPQPEAEQYLRKLEGYVNGDQGIGRYLSKSGGEPQSTPWKTKLAPGDVTGTDYRRLEALLAYPWLDPEQRKALWELKVAFCRELEKEQPSSDEPAIDDRREQRRDYLLKMLELGDCRRVVETLNERETRDPRKFGVRYYDLWINQIDPELLKLLKDDKKVFRTDRMLRLYYAINETHLSELAHWTSEAPVLYDALRKPNRLEQLELEAMPDFLDKN